jgi:hypothetical protein
MIEAMRLRGFSPHFDFEVPLPKRPQRIPALLTRAVVAGLLRASTTPKQHALLAT